MKYFDDKIEFEIFISKLKDLDIWDSIDKNQSVDGIYFKINTCGGLTYKLVTYPYLFKPRLCWWLKRPYSSFNAWDGSSFEEILEDSNDSLKLKLLYHMDLLNV